MLSLKISDLWVDGVGWDLGRIEPYMSSFAILCVRAVMVDSTTGVHDRVAWGESNDGNFSVKSAYYALCRDDTPRQNMELLFGRIWRTKVPERVRIFIWLVVNQVIMTNVERQRRHLSDTGVCQVCKGGEETIIHILRDCPAIAGVWMRLVSPSKRDRFFSQTLLEWTYTNLTEDAEMEGTPWSVLFGMVIWWGWKWRCGNVFGENGKWRDRVRFVKDLALDVHRAHLISKPEVAVVVRVTRQIAWTLPQREWVRLNTDGASRGNPGLAAAGGVLSWSVAGRILAEHWHMLCASCGALGGLLWAVPSLG